MQNLMQISNTFLYFANFFRADTVLSLFAIFYKTNAAETAQTGEKKNYTKTHHKVSCRFFIYGEKIQIVVP